MTQYQIAQFKRAVKKALKEKYLSPVEKNYVREKKQAELPDYIRNNPFYP